MAKAISLGPKPRIKDRWEERWKRNLRLLYLRLLRLRGEPQEVAGGVAIGVFCRNDPYGASAHGFGCPHRFDP